MQSVSKSTRRRSATAGVAAMCAVALTGSVVATGPATAQNPARSGDGARKVKVAEKGFKYKCKAKNDIVNDAIGGPQQFRVNGSATFKGKFKPGTVIRPKKIHLTLILPKKLTRKIRRDLGVKKVRGSARVKFDVRAKPGKDRKMKVEGLRSGWRRVPKHRKLRIPTTGHADNFRIPKRANKLKLYAPKRFKIKARLRPPAVGIVKKTRLNCRFNGKGRKIGNLRLR